jgi:hypothetical protein
MTTQIAAACRCITNGFAAYPSRRGSGCHIGGRIGGSLRKIALKAAKNLGNVEEGMGFEPTKGLDDP